MFESVGEWVRWVALLVHGFDHSGAAGAGQISVIQLVPAAILTPLTSSLADRFPRARVLLVGYLAGAIGTGGAGVAVAFDAPFALAAVLSAAAMSGITLNRATQGAAPRSRDDARGADRRQRDELPHPGDGDPRGSRAGGRAPGRVRRERGDDRRRRAVRRWIDPPLPPARRSARPAGPPETVDVLGGFRELTRNRGALLILSLLGLQAVTWGAVDVLIVRLAIDELDLGRSGAGLLAAAVGVGVAIGAAATVSLVGRARLGPAFGLGVAMWSLPLLGIALLLVPAWVVPLLAIAGAGFAFIDVSGRTLLQRTVDADVVGRVFGLLESGFMAAWAVGSALSPMALGVLSSRWTFVALGISVPVATTLGWARLRRVDAEAWVPSHELELLRSIDIFRPLRGPVLERLARRLREVDVPAGRTFIREGEPGDRFYAIVDGEVLVTAGGREIARLGPGGYVGEIALLRDVPRQASVTAVADTLMLALDREPFLEAVTGSRGAAEAARSGVEQRLAELEPHDEA